MEKYPLVRQDQLDTSQAENTIKMKKGGLVRQDQNKAFWSLFFFFYHCLHCETYWKKHHAMRMKFYSRNRQTGQSLWEDGRN